MRIRDIFITCDERRDRWRIQPMGWVVAAMAIILIASLASGAWRILSGPPLEVTPTAPATVTVSSSAGSPEPTATSIVRGCPEDPALWSLVPYSLPGLDGQRSRLYVVDPPCVMRLVEKAFARCVDLKAQRGRSWSGEDEKACYSTSDLTTILSEEDVPALAPGWDAYGKCEETVKDDGRPVTADDLHLVFYTMSDDKRVADVLVVNDSHPTVRTYDCQTGELMEKTPGDPEQTAVIYYPLLYEDGQWRLASRHDVAEFVPSDQIEADGLVSLVREAQGRPR